VCGLVPAATAGGKEKEKWREGEGKMNRNAYFGGVCGVKSVEVHHILGALQTKGSGMDSSGKTATAQKMRKNENWGVFQKVLTVAARCSKGGPTPGGWEGNPPRNGVKVAFPSKDSLKGSSGN